MKILPEGSVSGSKYKCEYLIPKKEIKKLKKVRYTPKLIKPCKSPSYTLIYDGRSKK